MSWDGWTVTREETGWAVGSFIPQTILRKETPLLAGDLDSRIRSYHAGSSVSFHESLYLSWSDPLPLTAECALSTVQSSSLTVMWSGSPTTSRTQDSTFCWTQSRIGRLCSCPVGCFSISSSYRRNMLKRRSHVPSSCNVS